jgi:hypothetical protein
MTIDVESRREHSLVNEVSGGYLGPAEVVEMRDGAIFVSLLEKKGETTRVALAFATPYQPALGDVLLVIGKPERHYAIGVLHGSGRTSLTFEGDVDLRSVDGKVRITGDRGVDIRGTEVQIQARSLDVIAKDVTERFTTFCQRVTSLLRVQSGESQTLIDGTSTTHAKRAAILTDETVTINGREVHLG